MEGSASGSVGGEGGSEGDKAEAMPALVREAENQAASAALTVKHGPLLRRAAIVHKCREMCIWSFGICPASMPWGRLPKSFAQPAATHVSAQKAGAG